MLLSGGADRDLKVKQLTDLGVSLPFVREPDLGLALVVKSHLDELSNDSSRRSDITKWFNHATDIHGDLEKAWLMWEAVSHHSTGRHHGMLLTCEQDQCRRPSSRVQHCEC